jgi:CRISPR-associated protein Csm3
MTQKGIKKINGKIVVKTGLHIGASNDRIEIGGMDQPVIKNPLTREPYIPGSSIKGKMRALCEWEKNMVSASGRNAGKTCDCGMADCPICRVFGAGIDSRDKEKALSRGPTRLIIRDAKLTQKYKDMYSDGKPILEDKSENGINRITADANPRHLERVIPEVEFEFELVYHIIDTGHKGKNGELLDEEYFRDVVLKGLYLLQNDYLGGGGSRGNGRIEFAGLKDEKGEDIPPLETYK